MRARLGQQPKEMKKKLQALKEEYRGPRTEAKKNNEK